MVCVDDSPLCTLTATVCPLAPSTHRAAGSSEPSLTGVTPGLSAARCPSLSSTQSTVHLVTPHTFCSRRSTQPSSAARPPDAYPASSAARLLTALFSTAARAAASFALAPSAVDSICRDACARKPRMMNSSCRSKGTPPALFASTRTAKTPFLALSVIATYSALRITHPGESTPSTNLGSNLSSPGVSSGSPSWAVAPVFITDPTTPDSGWNDACPVNCEKHSSCCPSSHSIATEAASHGHIFMPRRATASSAASTEASSLTSARSSVCSNRRRYSALFSRAMPASPQKAMMIS
mmetsp:Transcript_23893/g.81482  ORF Transcript_23893/g.81482 Transcript_23893/m.81482 type:complete len:294 (-) Transcript_23893:991-1872(-)